MPGPRSWRRGPTARSRRLRPLPRPRGDRTRLSSHLFQCFLLLVRYVGCPGVRQGLRREPTLHLNAVLRPGHKVRTFLSRAGRYQQCTEGLVPGEGWNSWKASHGVAHRPSTCSTAGQATPHCQSEQHVNLLLQGSPHKPSSSCPTWRCEHTELWAPSVCQVSPEGTDAQSPSAPSACPARVVLGKPAGSCAQSGTETRKTKNTTKLCATASRVHVTAEPHALAALPCASARSAG